MLNKTLPDWGRLTPARRIDVIKTVYGAHGGSALELTERIRATYDQVVSRNTILGIYSRSKDLRDTHPLTGNRQGGALGKNSREWLDERARIKNERRQVRQQRVEERQKAKANLAEVKAAAVKHDAEKRLNALPPETRERIEAIHSGLVEFERTKSLKLSLLELTSGDCRWPSAFAPFTFCGHSIHGKNSSYCTFHSKLAYQAK